MLNRSTENTKVDFYRCFRSFQFLLEELERAYKAHNHTRAVKYILMFEGNTATKKPTTGKTTRKQTREKKNWKTTTGRPNSMFTISNRFLDDKGNRDLIAWLEMQGKE